jgi:hypothetical protein
MRIEIRLKVLYDSETGKAEVKAISVSSGASAFGEEIATAAAAHDAESLPIDTGGKCLTEARHLADQLGIDESHVTDAFARRPPGRVVEVLRWMKKRRTTEAIRNAVGLFHTLVARD